MAALKVPTIFTAVDRFSAPILGMGNNVQAFANKMEAGIGRAEALTKKFTPTLSGLQKEMLSFLSTAVLIGAVMGTISFTFNGIKNYETEIANLSAVTGSSGEDLEKFKAKIKETAIDTKESAIDVAAAFTAIGNNQPQLLKDAEGLSAVAKASITLARASKMDLGPAGEALTSIMNQYSIAATGAGKTVDQLAAASQAGSAELVDVAASLQKFGPIAVSAGIKINESLALIEAGSKFFKEGTETGTKFLNIITTMAALKVQDPKALHDLKRLGVNMSIVTSKTTPLIDRLAELKKIGNDIPALFHVFGKENIAMAGAILNSTDRYTELLAKIDETGKAEEMAAKNNATFARSWEILKNKFITWVVTSDEASATLDILKKVLAFVGNNITTIVKSVGWAVAIFTAWKTLLTTARIAMIGYNIVVGINAALSTTTAAVISTNMIAQRAYIITTKLATAAMWLFNGALDANPVVALTLAFIAAGAATYFLVKAFSSVTDAERLSNEVRERALENSIDQRVEVTMLFDQLRRLHSGTEAYNEVLKKIESIQPGITAQYNLQAGALDNITRAENDLMKAIMKRAEIQARAELIREKTKELLQEGVTGTSWKDKLLGAMTPFGDVVLKAQRMAGLQKDIQALSQQQAEAETPTPAVNPRKAENDILLQHITTTENKEIKVSFDNLPPWARLSGDNSAMGTVIPSLSSTMSK